MMKDNKAMRVFIYPQKMNITSQHLFSQTSTLSGKYCREGKINELTNGSKKMNYHPKNILKNYKNKNEFIGKSHNTDQFDGGN